MLKDFLDMRICDIEKESKNVQTYREYIRESEIEFELRSRDLNRMSENDLIKYMDFLDYLWTK